ncbi:MAG: ATP-binding protein [Rubricoccaceae bacterium]
MRRLLGVALMLSAETRLEPLLDAILDAATDVLACAGASVLLYDERADALRFVAVRGADLAVLARVPVPTTGSLAGDVFTSNAPVVSVDARADTRHDATVAGMTGIATQALIGVPLAVEGRPLGVLQVLNPHGGVFAEDALELLDVLAAQAAVALRNAQQRAALHRVHEELAALDRVKTDFLTVASHELRTPLAAVLGFAASLRAEAAGSPLAAVAGEVEAAAGKVQQVVEAMTQVSLLGGEPLPADAPVVALQAVCAAAVRAALPAAEASGVTLQMRLHRVPRLVRAEAPALGRALAALLDNALAFAGPGGTVTLTADGDGEALVRIADTGPGIPPAERTRIFAPFYQIGGGDARAREGLGLGLAIAQRIAARHGGTVAVDDEATGDGRGGGATFRLTLPLAAPVV